VLTYVYRRVFKFHKWESVKCFICGLGKLDFWHVHMKSVVRFYKKLSHCSNTVIHTLFNTAVSQSYVHQFITVLDVNLSWPVYRLDSEVYEHFMSLAC